MTDRVCMSTPTHVQAALLRMTVLALGSDQPDRRTSMNDARTAHTLAKGVPVDDIDPTTGHDLSRHAYLAVRESWRELVTSTGPLSEYSRPKYEAARACWVARRPQYINGDDWLADVTPRAVS